MTRPHRGLGLDVPVPGHGAVSALDVHVPIERHTAFKKGII
jgi:hypothetical protein